MTAEGGPQEVRDEPPDLYGKVLGSACREFAFETMHTGKKYPAVWQGIGQSLRNK
jgi:hypothetical protein